MTISIDVINDGALNLLHDMERLNLIRVNSSVEKFKVEATVPPAPEPSAKNSYEAIERAAGLAKKLGFNLSSDRFLEMKRKEIELEEAQYRRNFHCEG
jgi:hypothetical protein